MFSILLFLSLSLVSLSVQQKDPLKDFCRLFGHQTTVVDRNLYIDGGLVNWSPISSSSLNYSSTWLRGGNLDENNEGFPQQAVLAKNESTPSVHGGILWSDEANKMVYQYGGEYGNHNPDEFKLWYYDIAYNTWNVSNASTTGVNRASWGAGATVQDKARGYYYGGWLTEDSVPGYDGETALSNMIVYDMLGMSFRNQSGPDAIARAEGAMTYIPAGDAGLLVYFGGVQFPDGKLEGMNMSEIKVYDVGNDKWYLETATGDVPEQRRRFCAGATWSEDRSSYNIYLYGGASIDKGVGFGDVYVLSLPSFKWIKFWPRDEDNIGAVFPHHSLSCDVIGGSQMIIMGGHFTNSSDCDVPTIYGQHGLNLGALKAGEAKWASFNPNLTTYKVPADIVKVIGGGADGGAKLLTPNGGFKNRDLNVQFSRAYTPAVRTATRFIPSAIEQTNTPTPPSAPKGSSKTPIIAGAAGGIVGLLILIAIVWGCMIMRRKKAAAARGPTSEMDSQTGINHISRNVSTRTHQTELDPNVAKDETWPPYGGQGNMGQYPGAPPPGHMARTLTQHSHQSSATGFSRSVSEPGAGYYPNTPHSAYTPHSAHTPHTPQTPYTPHTPHPHDPNFPHLAFDPNQPYIPNPNYNPGPSIPLPLPVLYEMPAASTVHELPVSRSPPSFSKPFHAQPEKFGRKFENLVSPGREMENPLSMNPTRPQRSQTVVKDDREGGYRPPIDDREGGYREVRPGPRRSHTAPGPKLGSGRYEPEPLKTMKGSGSMQKG